MAGSLTYSSKASAPSRGGSEPGRSLGDHPEGGAVTVKAGRFGPYVKHGDDFRSLESEEQVFAITLEDAVELLRQPKRARKRPFGADKKAPLRELGTNPAGVAVRLCDGRYGPYVTDGVVNATVPVNSVAR